MSIGEPCMRKSLRLTYGRWDVRRWAEDGARESGSAFAPVMAEAARLCADVPIGPAQPGGSPVIVIGGATIRIPPAIDTATLQTVLRTLMAAT
jgi:hypothetical protein